MFKSLGDDGGLLKRKKRCALRRREVLEEKGDVCLEESESVQVIEEKEEVYFG